MRSRQLCGYRIRYQVVDFPGGTPGDIAKRKAYETELRKLQVELCHLQEW